MIGAGWESSLAVDSYRRNSEDRATVVQTSFGLVALIADGVGGRSGGGAAADYFLNTATAWAHSLMSAPSAKDLYAFLRNIDSKMSQIPEVGETTAVVVVLDESGIAGVATGDSIVWWIDDSGHIDLTADSGEKPWLGSGMARISSFAHAGLAERQGSLLIATDGLSKYADRETLCGIVRRVSLSSGPCELIKSVRPPSHTLPDDIAVVLARQSAN